MHVTIKETNEIKELEGVLFWDKKSTYLHLTAAVFVASDGTIYDSRFTVVEGKAGYSCSQNFYDKYVEILEARAKAGGGPLEYQQAWWKELYTAPVLKEAAVVLTV